MCAVLYSSPQVLRRALRCGRTNLNGASKGFSSFLLPQMEEWQQRRASLDMGLFALRLLVNGVSAVSLGQTGLGVWRERLPGSDSGLGWARQLFAQGAQRGEGSLEAGRLIVLVQVALERKRLVAAFTLVVLEGRMRLHVGAQVGPVGKGLSAVRTPEGLLARVGAHVALQQPGSAEGLATHVALVLEVVGEQVHGHGGHGNVDFAAGGALLGHLAVQAPVRLLVSAQVGGGGVGFPALAAGVPLGGSRARRGSPPGPPVHDKEGIHGVALADSRVPVDVPAGGRRGLGARAVRLVRIAVEVAVDTRIGVIDAAVDDGRVAR